MNVFFDLLNALEITIFPKRALGRLKSRQKRDVETSSKILELAARVKDFDTAKQSYHDILSAERFDSTFGICNVAKRAEVLLRLAIYELVFLKDHELAYATAARVRELNSSNPAVEQALKEIFPKL